MNQDSAKGQKKILCIDDEEELLNALRRLFRSLPYQVITESDVEEALKIAIQEVPALIILDVMMPAMSGYEFLERLKKVGLGEIPVVLLTGTMNFEKGYRQGCVYYITKPYNNDYVLNIVEYVLGNPAPERREWLEKNL